MKHSKAFMIGLLFLAQFSLAQQSKFDRSYPRYTDSLNKKTEHPLINDSTIQLTKISPDAEYGWTARKPVMLGLAYVPDSAATYREKYLNALRDSKGEMIKFERLAACCVFHTPNQLRYWLKKDPEQAKFGLLERYKIWFDENKEEKILYINIYDEGPLMVPSGLKTAN